jgi:hypothetical protein
MKAFLCGLLLLLASCTPQATPALSVLTPGTLPLTTVVGFVFLDTNGDGVRQTTETAGLAGVDVSLEPYHTQTVEPEGWYSLNVTPGNYTLEFTLPPGWRATGALVRELLVTGTKQTIYLGVQPLPTPAPSATPSPTAQTWSVVPAANDCFDLTRLSDGAVYALCMKESPLFRVTLKPTPTVEG